MAKASISHLPGGPGPKVRRNAESREVLGSGRIDWRIRSRWQEAWIECFILASAATPLIIADVMVRHLCER